MTHAHTHTHTHITTQVVSNYEDLLSQATGLEALESMDAFVCVCVCLCAADNCVYNNMCY